MKLRGFKDELDKLSPDDVLAIADLTDYDITTGSNIVNAKIQVDGSLSVGAVDSYQIVVDIRKENP